MHNQQKEESNLERIERLPHVIVIVMCKVCGYYRDSGVASSIFHYDGNYLGQQM